MRYQLKYSNGVIQKIKLCYSFQYFKQYDLEIYLKRYTNNDRSSVFQLESSNTDGLRVLHLRNVNHTHSGEIKLSILNEGKSNYYPAVDSCTSLMVYPSKDEQVENRKYDSPAYIIKRPADCTALIGGTIQLSVTFYGYPTPNIKWLRGSRPITHNSNITIQNKAGSSILKITNITADESGKYTVEVMNNLGMDVAAASVAVEGPPEPPSGKPSISRGPDRIAIAWCGPPYDGGCMITGFM